MGDTPTPAYLLAQLDVKNHEDYMQRYGMPTISILEKYGAEVLVASATPKKVEGNMGGNWTVVLRFPSSAIAEAFYNSPEYQPLKALRVNELTKSGSVLLVDGFDAAALGGTT